MTESQAANPDPMACPSCGSTHLRFYSKVEYRLDGTVQKLAGGEYEINSDCFQNPSPSLNLNNIAICCVSCNRPIDPDTSLRVRTRIVKWFQSELRRNQQSRDFAPSLARHQD